MQLNEAKSDLGIGVFFVAFALIFYFILNPLLIVVPNAALHADSAFLSPIALPNTLCASILIFSIGLIISRIPEAMRAGTASPDRPPLDRRALCCRLAAISTLLALPVVTDKLGIILGGIVFYILFALFTGERKFARCLSGAILTSILLYACFGHLAGVPLPLGPLADIVYGV